MLISLVFDQSLTDGQTDGRTDRPSYIDARTHLKTWESQRIWWQKITCRFRALLQQRTNGIPWMLTLNRLQKTKRPQIDHFHDACIPLCNICNILAAFIVFQRWWRCTLILTYKSVFEFDDLYIWVGEHTCTSIISWNVSTQGTKFPISLLTTQLAKSTQLAYDGWGHLAVGSGGGGGRQGWWRWKVI